MENPPFEVNSALPSRCRVFALRPLEEAELRELLARTLTEPSRGLGAEGLSAAPEFFEHVAQRSTGDARRALSALEVPAAPARVGGRKRLDLHHPQEPLQPQHPLSP